MDEWIQDIGRWMGLSPAAAALVAAAVGAAMVMLGVGWLLRIWLNRHGPPLAPRLMPTLVEDVLDEDLGEIYGRSLWLDAELLDAHSLGGATGSCLGRAIRKRVVRVQADRVAPLWSEAVRGEAPPLKTPDERAAAASQVALLNGVLDESLGYLAGLDDAPRGSADARTAEARGAAITSALQQWVRLVEQSGGDDRALE